MAVAPIRHSQTNYQFVNSAHAVELGLITRADEIASASKPVLVRCSGEKPVEVIATGSDYGDLSDAFNKVFAQGWSEGYRYGIDDPRRDDY